MKATTSLINYYQLFLVNGGWTAWSSWSECLSSCDDGVRHRDRNCTEPAPSEKGAFCKRNEKGIMEEELEECNVRICLKGIKDTQEMCLQDLRKPEVINSEEILK